MAKFIAGAGSDDIFMALHKAGVFEDDPAYVRRVIIDLEVGNVARFYVERYADDILTEVLLEGGIKLVERAAGPDEATP